MTILFDWLISNAVVASLLAMVALVVNFTFPRRPALAHACWLLVLLKLLTPPVYVFSVSTPVASVSPVTSAPAATSKDTSAKELPATPLTASGTTPTAQDDSVITEEVMTNDLSLLIPVTGPAPTTTESIPRSEPATPSASEPPITWYQTIFSFWTTQSETILVTIQWIMIGGSVVLFVITLYRIIRFENMLHLATPAPETLQAIQRQIGTGMELSKLPRLVVVPGKVGPLLWQRWNDPIIVLPAGLLEAMHEGELRTVLAHELTHYRRGDPFWRYLELAAVTLYWWLPTSWWASRRLRQAEEECCDAGVVASLPDGAASYATALVRSLSFVTEARQPCAALSSGLGPVTLLKRRLIMLHKNVERRLGLRSWFMVLAVAALALPVGFSWAKSDVVPTYASETVAADDDDDETKPDRLPPVTSVPSRPASPISPASPTMPARAVQPPMSTTAAPSGYYAAPAAGGYTAYVPYTTPQGAAPGSPPPYGVGNLYQDSEARSSAEMAVRQAELELKARRIKARQAANGVRTAEAELGRANKNAQTGAVSQTDVEVARTRLDSAKDEAELAQVEVERAELAVEQAKRRMSSYNRGVFPAQPTAPRGGGVTPALPPAGGASAPMVTPPAGGPGTLPPAVPGSGGDAVPAPGAMAGGGVRRPPGGSELAPLRRSGGGEATAPSPSRGGLGGGGGLGGAGGAGGLGGRGGVGEANSFGRGGMGTGVGMARSSDPFFRNFDRRGTGKIERNDVPEWMRERFFETVDANKDGVVDEAEFSANYNKLWDTGRGATPSRAGGGVGRTAPDSRAGGRDPRDERIKQLEEELKELRRTLESMKKPVGGEGATR